MSRLTPPPSRAIFDRCHLPAAVRGRVLVVGSSDPPSPSRHGAGPPRLFTHILQQSTSSMTKYTKPSHIPGHSTTTPSAVRTHHDHGDLTPTVNRCAYRPLQLGTLLRASFWARPRRRVLQHAEQTLQYLHRRFVASHCCDRRHFVRRDLHLHAQPLPDSQLEYTFSEIVCGCRHAPVLIAGGRQPGRQIDAPPHGRLFIRGPCRRAQTCVDRKED